MKPRDCRSEASGADSGLSIPVAVILGEFHDFVWLDVGDGWRFGPAKDDPSDLAPGEAVFSRDFAVTRVLRLSNDLAQYGGIEGAKWHDDIALRHEAADTINRLRVRLCARSQAPHQPTFIRRQGTESTSAQIARRTETFDLGEKRVSLVAGAPWPTALKLSACALYGTAKAGVTDASLARHIRSSSSVENFGDQRLPIHSPGMRCEGSGFENLSGRYRGGGTIVEIETSEFPMQKERRAIVGPGSTFSIAIGSKWVNLTVASDLGEMDIPATVGALKLVSAVAAVLFPVLHVLRVSADAQVIALIVPRVAVDVVNDHPIGRSHDMMSEKQDLAALRHARSARWPLFLIAPTTTIVGVPAMPRESRVIRVINDHGIALRGGDQHAHAALTSLEGTASGLTSVWRCTCPPVRRTISIAMASDGSR